MHYNCSKNAKENWWLNTIISVSSMCPFHIRDHLISVECDTNADILNPYVSVIVSEPRTHHIMFSNKKSKLMTVRLFTYDKKGIYIYSRRRDVGITVGAECFQPIQPQARLTIERNHVHGR